jgi:DNA-binding CsgD family transcriptional regulator
MDGVNESFLSLNSDLSEIALASRDRAQFRDAAGSLLCEKLGWDTADFYHSPDGRRTVARCAHGPGGEELERRIGEFIADVSHEELARGACGRAVRDEEIFDKRRRERLALYTEYLLPNQVRSFLARMWCHPLGAFWVTFARVGQSAVVLDRDLKAFDLVFPSLAVAEVLHAANSATGDAAAQLDWARDQKVTASEFRVASLAARGLTNPEIAVVVGISPNTVRNQLASTFQKLGVSTRAELTYMLQIRPPSIRSVRSTESPCEELLRAHDAGRSFAIASALHARGLAPPSTRQMK